MAYDESFDGGHQSADLLVASNGKIEGQWVLDFGYSFHKSPHKTLFHKYEAIDGGSLNGKLQCLYNCWYWLC